MVVHALAYARNPKVFLGLDDAWGGQQAIYYLVDHADNEAGPSGTSLYEKHDVDAFKPASRVNGNEPGKPSHREGTIVTVLETRETESFARVYDSSGSYAPKGAWLARKQSVRAKTTGTIIDNFALADESVVSETAKEDEDSPEPWADYNCLAKATVPEETVLKVSIAGGFDAQPEYGPAEGDQLRYLREDLSGGVVQFYSPNYPDNELAEDGNWRTLGSIEDLASAPDKLDDRWSDSESYECSSGGGRMEVTFVDVGKGASILIQGPDGNNVLVDAGTKSSTSENWENLRDTLEPVDDLNAIVVTHNHSDHTKFVDDVVEDGPIDEVFNIYHSGYGESEVLEDVTSGDPTEEDTVGNMEQLDEGSELGFSDEVDVQVYQREGVGGTDKNGLVLELTYSGKTFLLTADIKNADERHFTDEHNLGDVDVLKATHHGSGGSHNSEQLYTKTDPNYVVISNDNGGSSFSPGDRVFDHIKETQDEDGGIDTYWTAVHGDVEFIVDDDGISVVADDEDKSTDASDLEDESESASSIQGPLSTNSIRGSPPVAG